MKVSEASDDELNRFIANLFESEPEIPSNFEFGADDVYPIGYAGAWFVVQAYQDGDIPKVWPRAFTNTGDGLKMLLEHHKFVSLNKLDDCDEGNWEACFCKSETHSISCEEFGRALADDMGHALCRAFAIANGWKE